MLSGHTAGTGVTPARSFRIIDVCEEATNTVATNPMITSATPN